MPRKYISSLKTGDLIEEVFLVLKKEVKETREKKAVPQPSTGRQIRFYRSAEMGCNTPAL